MHHKNSDATYLPTLLELDSDILHNVEMFLLDLLCELTAQLFQLCTVEFRLRIQLSQHPQNFY